MWMAHCISHGVWLLRLLVFALGARGDVGRSGSQGGLLEKEVLGLFLLMEVSCWVVGCEGMGDLCGRLGAVRDF